MSCTLACLVLQGWELDVLECVVITVAVGLAVDLTLHFAVAFTLHSDLGQHMRIIHVIGRMGSPVSMAALTTMLAGALMMPSTILAYRKFGLFLMTLVAIAWLYAIFFFLALLCAIGPHGEFGQFSWPEFEFCESPESKHQDKTIYSLAESTLSYSGSSRDHSCVSRHTSNYMHVHGRQVWKGANDSQKYFIKSPNQFCHQHYPPRRKCDYTAVQTSLSSEENDQDSKQHCDNIEGNVFSHLSDNCEGKNNIEELDVNYRNNSEGGMKIDKHVDANQGVKNGEACTVTGSFWQGPTDLRNSQLASPSHRTSQAVIDSFPYIDGDHSKLV